MQNTFLPLASLAFAVLVTSGAAIGQNVTQLPTNEGNMSGNLTFPAARHSCGCTADREFLDQITATLAAQLASSESAARNTGRSDIRGIADTLHHDDLETTSRLATMARQAGLPQQPNVSPTQRAAVMDGGGAPLDAPYSDAAFIARQIESRQRAIAVFEKESQSGSDASLRSFARQRLPSLRDQVHVLQLLAA